jgi:ABC-type transport system substrate-binding protein
MMSYTKFMTGLLLLACSLVAADPAVGTWKLNISKSKFSPGPPPQSATVTYEETAHGIKRTGEAVNAEGNKTSFDYTAQYDGKDYPVNGNRNADTISLKRVNDRTVESTLKKDGKVVTTVRRVVSPDGKTMTLTITGTNAQGQKVNNVQVFDKQ